MILADKKSLVAGRCGRERKHYTRRIFLRTINTLCRFLVVGLLGFKDVGHERLRIAINDGEPGALYLDHDAMALFEDVTRGVQINGEWRYGVRPDGLRFFK